MKIVQLPVLEEPRDDLPPDLLRSPHYRWGSYQATRQHMPFHGQWELVGMTVDGQPQSSASQQLTFEEHYVSGSLGDQEVDGTFEPCSAGAVDQMLFFLPKRVSRWFYQRSVDEFSVRELAQGERKSGSWDSSRGRIYHLRRVHH